MHIGHKRTKICQKPNENFDPLRKEKKESLEKCKTWM